jgi:rubrerythrin
VAGLTRAELLGRTAKGGAALAVGGGIVGSLASQASAAIGTDDIPLVTQAVAIELLGGVFYTQALSTGGTNARDTRYFKRALANENDHYKAVAQILTDAKQTPGTADDFNFAFPTGAFATTRSIAKLGVQLETIFLGSYLGAVAALKDANTRAVFARIAASQAQHLSLLSGIALNKPIGMSFPVPLTLDAVSLALDPFIS